MPSDELSHIGKAAIAELTSKHEVYNEKLWAETSGSMTGRGIAHSPEGTWNIDKDPAEGHSNWLPSELASLLSKTEAWCDFASLSPPSPDGKFEALIIEALQTIAQRSIDTDKKIIVRFLFGNVIAFPVNCDAVMKKFTAALPKDSKLSIWVGAWRKGMCWNHAKIVAVDGKEVYTGGHNLWDDVYLQNDPIHDTSIHLKGEVAVQAHLFMNTQWSFIRDRQSTWTGWVVDKFYNDGWILPAVTRVTISEWPEKISSKYAPVFEKDTVRASRLDSVDDASDDDDVVPILALGRYGNIVDNARSSDDAFIAMFQAAQKSIKFILQDLGPVNKTVLGKKIVYKTWPKAYFRTFSKAMFERDVDIEIILSNPESGEARGNYSNGWSCEEVAAEIIKTMKEQFPEASDDLLKKKTKDNLRVCFLRNKIGNRWVSNNKVGLHSKFFIVDDVCTYVGSQNLYKFDLAEWGVAIDSEKKTFEIKSQLWDPMWNASYLDGSDVNEDRVIEILGIDRDPNGTISDKELSELESDLDYKHMKASDYYDDENIAVGTIASFLSYYF